MKLKYYWHSDDANIRGDRGTEISYEKALDICLGTWRDNDMTRDMLSIPNRIGCQYGYITSQSEDGMVLMAGLWNIVPMRIEYDKNGNHVK